MHSTTVEKQTAWSPTSVQFLYRHRNGRYYVRTYAGGKEKWTSLRTNLLTVAKNRMKEHVDAAERQRTTGNISDIVGKLTFGDAMKAYREELATADIRPNTKAYREAGLKLVLKSWDDVESTNVRRITSKTVEDWLKRFKANAKPYIPNGAKKAARNSTGASTTTMKCALDAVRQVLDIAVQAGHLYANPARNSTVTDSVRKIFKVSRRERAVRAPLRLPTREEFISLIEATRAHLGIRTATHKLIYYWKKDMYELFDLTQDPTEQHNLLFSETEANKPEVVKVFTELKAEIARLQKEYKDDGQYADAADWPEGSADGPFNDKQPLGPKSVQEAIAASDAR